MNRSASLDRRHRRILFGGVSASIAVHAALFATLQFDIPQLGKRADMVAVLPAPEPEQPEEEPMKTELIQIASASAPATAAGDGGAASVPPQGVQAAGRLSIAASAAPVEAAIADFATKPAFEQLAVVDPMTRAAIRPVAFDALPAAETTAEGDDGDDGVPLYVPGSIGKAKRQWAKGMGESDAGNGGGIRIGIGLGSGGHCPMPGRVPVSWNARLPNF